MLNEQLINKWQPVLDHEDLPEIKDHYRKVVTAHMLEQQENAMAEQAAVQGAGSSSLLGESLAPEVVTTNVDKFDPVLISLVRRTAPNLIAFDVMGVQPMSGPTGLIFALRPTYGNDLSGLDQGQNANAFYDEANTAFSGGGSDAIVPAHSTTEGTTKIANTYLGQSGGLAAATLAGATGAAANPPD